MFDEEGIEALFPVPSVDHIGTFASYDLAKRSNPCRGWMDGSRWPRHETQVLLLGHLEQRAWRCEEHHVVTVKIPDRGGKVHGIHEGAAHDEVVGKDEDLHGVPTVCALPFGSTYFNRPFSSRAYAAV